jgi:hypothetical protein
MARVIKAVPAHCGRIQFHQLVNFRSLTCPSVTIISFLQWRHRVFEAESDLLSARVVPSIFGHVIK